MRKTSGLIAGMVACFAFSQAAGAMPVDKAIAARQIMGGNGLVLPGALPARPPRASSHHRYQGGRYIYRPEPYYFGYPAWYGYSAPVYIPFDHGYGGHHFEWSSQLRP